MATERKIGAGHAQAMGRLGFHELGALFTPAGNIAQPSEPGVYGTLTPMEVMEQKAADSIQAPVAETTQETAETAPEATAPQVESPLAAAQARAAEAAGPELSQDKSIELEP